ncbi:MAG: PAS domain-containing protein [Rhizobiales bacterium]|nr:PAS domain-containing protein [Hyphomicrobiales bacterium]
MKPLYVNFCRNTVQGAAPENEEAEGRRLMRTTYAREGGRAETAASSSVWPFEAASFGVLKLAEGGRIVEANSAFRNMLGHEPADIEVRALGSLLYREPGAPARTDPWGYLLASLDAPAEIKFRHKSGAPKWALFSLSTTGEAGCHLAILIPIDEQKRREAAAARDLEHLSFALDAANQGIWNYDGVKDVWTFSAAWKRMRGISSRENYVAQGFDWLETIHPDDRAMVKDYSERQYSGELEEVAFQYREKHRDGHWMWILARGRALGGRTADGRPLRIVGTDTDITDIKIKEHDFETISRRLELALATSRVGVWEADLRTGAAFWDARTNQLFGRDDVAVTVPPGTWENLLHPEDRLAIVTKCQEGLATERGFAIDYRVILDSGEIRHIRCRSALVKDATAKKNLSASIGM